MPNKQQEWNVLLCDDEPLVLDRLLALSQKTLLPQYNAVFHCAVGAEALPDSSVQLHIAVLDIVLKQDNGISLARSIVEKLRRWTKGYTIKQPNMDCQPTEITALMRHRAVFS